MGIHDAHGRESIRVGGRGVGDQGIVFVGKDGLNEHRPVHSILVHVSAQDLQRNAGERADDGGGRVGKFRSGRPDVGVRVYNHGDLPVILVFFQSTRLAFAEE